MVSDGESGAPAQPELRWAKVTGPDAMQPLDRHWVRYVRLVLLLAAVLIAWRILAWQEDGYPGCRVGGRQHDGRAATVDLGAGPHVRHHAGGRASRGSDRGAITHAHGQPDAGSHAYANAGPYTGDPRGAARRDSHWHLRTL